MERERIRAETLQRRDGLAQEVRSVLSRRIINFLVSWIQNEDFDTVMLYLSMKSEVETFSLLDILLHQEKIVCAPVVDTHQLELTPRQIRNPKTELVQHRYGLLEPNAACPILPVSQLQLIIVPGIAFDANGYRLGYGKGFYDRFLTKCPDAVRVGLAYQVQIVEDTCPQTWDLPVHYIFTEKGIIDGSDQPSAVS
ncbi:MAG: 5-formyltetrahydrofolate cyclo-ligase [Candidatus Poribacteria bacterium]|nr:5-formyltetrahydrofolate cyclo-ligase [Candidatus Poribacteria bacterium]